jgi:MoaA/NifB/PqqE/SkfB family radical SAM enzyme
MFSGPWNSTHLNFNKFKKIIDRSEGSFIEVQLEGGEPLLHEDLYLFLEYLRFTKRCIKIIISTNGIELKDHLERLITFCKYSNNNHYKIKLVIKKSINYHLYNLNNNIFKECNDLYLATEFIPNFKIEFNVRLRKEDNWIIEKLKEFNILKQSKVFELQNYGRMNNSNYSKPFIVQNINKFSLFASDGKYFNHNLIKRSNYEKTLI